MKYCPTCRTQYTDHTLRFCLQDGDLLADAGDVDTPKAALDETPTLVRQAPVTPVTTRLDNEFVRSGNPGTRQRRSSPILPLAAAAAALLLLFIGAAVGISLYTRNGQPKQPSNIAANVINANGRLPPNVGADPTSPANSNKKTPIPSPSETPGPVDRGNARKEVSQVINDWKSIGGGRDLNSYMEHYADRVDYYDRSGASRSYVRNDKKRAFGLYDSMNITISNMNVSVDDNGERATAEFDKEWDFRGPRDSSGKVRSQLRLRLMDGRWLITGEKDLKVYRAN